MPGSTSPRGLAGLLCRRSLSAVFALLKPSRVTADRTLRRGLGILAWRNLSGLDAILKGYADAGLPDLFADRVIWFQDIGGDARALATRHGYRAAGSDENIGILGGFQNLARTLETDLTLLLEDDLPLVEDAEETSRQIDEATDLLLGGRAQVVRLRSRRLPGEKFDLPKKYRRYHGDALLAPLRRTLRPGKAKRMAGGAVYVREKADRAHRGVIDRADDGTYLVSAAALPWTNQSVMVRRDFFLDRICAQAAANPSRRRVNGFPDIEKEWNSKRWRRSGWTVGVPEGLFTHERPS